VDPARNTPRLTPVTHHEVDPQVDLHHVTGLDLGIGAETLRNWVKRAEIDSGERPGTSSDDAQRIAELERENWELRRANDILKAAAAFFGAELDRPSRR